MEEILKKIEKLLTIKKVKTDEYDTIFIDLNKEKISPNVYSQKGYLKYTIETNNDYIEILNLIKTNFDNLINKKKKENSLSHLILNNDNLTAENLIIRLKHCSNMIGCNGRIGFANTIILNENYYDLIKNENKLNECDIIIDNTLNDKIYIYRKNQIEQPGTIFIYNEENNNFNIENIGFYPEEQIEIINII
jgi:hypothetical protein